MTEKDAVLSANLDFYHAFATRDLERMASLWAQHLPVSCVHPGWAALRERAAVLRSWRDIFSDPEAPKITCHDEDAALYDDFAIVTCEEDLSTATLAATNIYAKEHGVWRIVHHQAGPLLLQQGRRRPSPPTRIH
jgi:ketosteroid isomerase-like protein